MKCECCGRLIVLLRKSDAQPGQNKWRAVYLKTWDGNPWYVPGIHTAHPRKRYAIRMKAKLGGGEPEDPFFSLD